MERWHGEHRIIATKGTIWAFSEGREGEHRRVPLDDMKRHTNKYTDPGNAVMKVQMLTSFLREVLAFRCSESSTAALKMARWGDLS